MAKDYYLVLGISRGADLNKIKRAYRKIAKQLHPDVTHSSLDAERFIEIREAYETLADEAKRRKYDADLQKQGSSLRVYAVPETIRKRRSVFKEMDSFESLVDDFFEGFLPGFFSRERSRSTAKDLYYEVVLSPEEARKGGLFPISVPVVAPCPRCGKTGLWEEFFCQVCLGQGRISAEREFSLSIPPRTHHGTSMTLSLEDIGLQGAYLHVLVSIDPSMS
jgi:molecular chaperone DnaJ